MFYYKETSEFGVLPYLVGKLYKREFIEKGMQDIDDQIQYAEDRALMFWSMLNAWKTVFIESEQYYYLIHEESLCTSADEQFLIKMTYFFTYTKKLFEQIEPGQSIGIFIGPEGGFEEEEVAKALEAGAHAITLGRRILRTETAGLAILSVLMFQLENE